MTPARFAILSAIIAAAAGSPASSQEAAAPVEPARFAFRPVVERAIDAVILPGYRALSENAAAEATLVNDLCWQADAKRLEAAREGFADVVLAWSRVELIRFGPPRDRNRYERLFFWPDPRGRGLQQVQEIIAAEDTAATSIDTLRDKSAAVQGLFALEFVLFGTGSEGLADAADPARSFRCRFGAAIAGAVHRTAEEIVDGWTGEDGYAALMNDAGADNPVYRSHGEAVQELIKSAREELQLVRDLKIAHAIEDSPGKAQPKRAPFWRSDLTIPSIRANVEAVVDLVGPEGIGSALPRDEPWIANELAFELHEVDKTLARIEGRGERWEELVKDNGSHADLSYTLIPLASAIALLEGGYPGALGLITGLIRSMATDRRNFLRSLVALGALPFATIARADGGPAFVAARMDGEDAFSVAVLDHAGEVLFTEQLDARAHDIALSPDRSTAVVFARRPGWFALVIDLAGRRKVKTFTPPEGRHFYGHGLFSADGQILYATENDWEGERGVLGVYDVAAGYVRIGEFDTHGIDPHEAFLMSDGRTIAVANGGIATHPDFDRVKLNLATMEPSLVRLDARTGDLVDRQTLPQSLHQLSIRHMAESGDGLVWFGGQYEGAATDAVDLVGCHRLGRDIELVPAPPSVYAGMRQYIGSMAVSRDGARIAATSPVGGRMLIFDAETREVIAFRDVADICGVAGHRGDFFASDGRGRLWRGAALLSEDPGVAWDNHLRRIG